MTEVKTYDLHGYEKMAMEDGSGEITCVERVTLPDHDEAAEFLGNELCVNPADLDLQPVHMRWADSLDDGPFKNQDGYEFDDGWLECKADHPDAIPFWKDAP